MTENKTSNLINGISRGFYRIALVIAVGIVVVGVWNIFDASVTFKPVYRFGFLSSTPTKVSGCVKGDESFNDWHAAETPKGARVDIEYCFATMEVVNDTGKTFTGVPYRKTDKGYYFVEQSPSKYGSKEGDRYVKNLMSQFVISGDDLKELDKSYWREKFSKMGEYLSYLAGGLLGWALFCFVIRFIWRGFTNRD